MPSRRAATSEWGGHGSEVNQGLQQFPFAFDDRRLAALAAVFGVRPATASVDVGADRFGVRFGPWRLETERANVAGTEITGPYSVWKVAGPAHLSLADRGVTFATTTARGVCVRFHRPVPALLPFGLITHPGATVTVADCEALVAALAR